MCELDIELKFEMDVGSVEDYCKDYDLVVVVDGLNFRI